MLSERSRMDNRILIFKAKHRPVWHWDDYAEGVENFSRNGPPAYFRSACGFESRLMFCDFHITESDEIPNNFCELCYRLLTGMKKQKSHEPVTLKLKAIKGGTEGWRPDFMKTEAKK